MDQRNNRIHWAAVEEGRKIQFVDNLEGVKFQKIIFILYYVKL